MIQISETEYRNNASTKPSFELKASKTRAPKALVVTKDPSTPEGRKRFLAYISSRLSNVPNVTESP